MDFLGCDLVNEKRALFENRNKSRIELTISHLNSNDYSLVFRYKLDDYFYVPMLADNELSKLFKINTHANLDHQTELIKKHITYILDYFINKHPSDSKLYNFLLDQHLSHEKTITKEFYLYFYKIHQSSNHPKLDWIESKLTILKNLISKNIPVKVFSYENSKGEYKTINDMNIFSQFINFKN